MFTGIIVALAPVARVARSGGGLELALARPRGLEGTHDGDSIAVNGVCLTVTRHDHELAFDVIAETLARSNLGELAKGDLVNVEPSLRVGDPLGGHLVYGHVDATCAILSREPEGSSVRMWCATPPALRPLIVEKGFVSLDGVSLTVAGVRSDRFAVALVPETLKRTTLGRKSAGLSLNIEADPVARYVAALVGDLHPAPPNPQAP